MEFIIGNIYPVLDAGHRVSTGVDQLTIAAERLAVIAALTLPITSLSSVMGVNVVVNDSMRWIPLIILCLIMLAIRWSCWARPANWPGGEHPIIGIGLRV